MSRLLAVLPALLILLAQPRLTLALLILVTGGTAMAVRFLLRHRTVFGTGRARWA